MRERREVSHVAPFSPSAPGVAISCPFPVPFQVACQSSVQAVALPPFPVLTGFMFLGFCEVLSDVEAAVDSLPVSGGRG